MKAKYEYALAHRDYTGTERSRRFRARKKIEREAAKVIADREAAVTARLAAEQHRRDLDAARTAKGKPPAMNSTERSRRTRAAQKAAREAREAEANKLTPLSELVNFVL
jgi:hypothetical protein